MSLSCFFNPLHGCLLHADGHGEVWTDWNSTSKFYQYGWRCTTNEDMYTSPTLLGNWNEERYDIQRRRQLKPLPSQYNHYFESTYGTDYSKEKPRRFIRVMKQPHWFPGHQPELEPPPIKPTARSCYMIDYEPPHGRAACALVEAKPKEVAETPPQAVGRCSRIPWGWKSLPRGGSLLAPPPRSEEAHSLGPPFLK